LVLRINAPRQTCEVRNLLDIMYVCSKLEHSNEHSTAQDTRYFRAADYTWAP